MAEDQEFTIETVDISGVYNARQDTHTALNQFTQRLKEASAAAKAIREGKHTSADIELLWRVLKSADADLVKLRTHVLTFQENAKKTINLQHNALLQDKELFTQLRAAVEEYRAACAVLQETIDRLTTPPYLYGQFRCRNANGTIKVFVDGRTMGVAVHPMLDAYPFQIGESLCLTAEGYAVLDVDGFEDKGEIVRIKEFLDNNRAIVALRADESMVISFAGSVDPTTLKIDEYVRIDPRSGFAFERMPKSDVEEVVLEEVPNVTYNDIGGLKEQIEQLRDAIELPYRYPDKFRAYKLTPPKGILLYGPPGCGKTLIAKAVANSMATQIRERTGKDVKPFFLNVKGPELLNKYVGETEHKIREVFKKAKEKASAGQPVIVFFDEMDSIFRLRGSGVSSDIEITIVAQFLAELDGLESLKNVIVIGASNRQDLIDPAVLRPGRLDLKIKVNRPDQAAARDIFSKYLPIDIPLDHNDLMNHGNDPAATIRALIERTASEMYAETDLSKFIEVTYESRNKETFYFKDFASGAMIENIVARAKKYALKRDIASGTVGLSLQDLVSAIADEYKENEDLPNTTDPSNWSLISGKRGERVINVRPLVNAAPRIIEDVSGGQYL